MKIADVFIQAVLDDGQLKLDAAKSGAAAGQILGQSMSGKLASALKTTAFTALAAGAAIAGRGLLELNGIQADFQAATGATAAEAEAAGKAINAMGGRNLDSLKDIGSTLIEVETRLNQTGDAAFATTERFLKFGTATRQGPAEAVKAFDDILDAWGLTADHSGEIMDKLIVSHQRYGGSIEEDQRALAQFAPQLKALNATVDDGIGLLNLFAASGLDASVATRALNTAVTKLKPGQNLNDLVLQITAIEDPTKRAQKAVELFGARGGVALANALKPGVKGLKDFEISATDAAGATDKAAGVIEDSFGNRIKLAIKGAGAAIIGFGQTIGPLGSALTGLVSIAGALGPKLGPALAGAWKVAAASSILGGAIGWAADQAATVYIKGLIAKDSIGTALASGWAAATGKVIAAAEALGIASYAAVAAPFALPIIATIIIAAILPPGPKYQEVKDQATEDLGKMFAGVDWTGASEKAGDAMVAAWKAQHVTGKMADDIVRGVPTITRAMTLAVKAGTGRLATDITLAVKDAFGSDLAARNGYGRRLGNLAMAAVAQGIHDKRDAVDTAWQALLDAIHNGMKPAAERAKLVGELVSTDLIWGLKSKDPAVRAQAIATKQTILDRLAELGGAAAGIGKAGMESLRKAMKSKDPDIRRAAYEIYKTAHEQLAKLPAAGSAAGRNAGQGVADGLDAKLGAVRAAAFRLIQAALAAFNTTGTLGDKHRATGGPVAAGTAYTVGENGPETFVPRTSGTIIPNMRWSGMSPAFAGAGGTAAIVNNYYNTANVQGLVKAPDALSIARELGRSARNMRPVKR